MIAGPTARGGSALPLLPALPYLWLLLFFLAPFAILLKISLSEPALSIPPYTSLIASDGDGAVTIRLAFGNFTLLVEDRLYWYAYLNAARIAAISTVLALLLGSPMAWAMARAEGRRRAVLVVLVILPFWTSFLLRVYAWKVLLQRDGVVSGLAQAVGLSEGPVSLLYDETALLLGMTYTYLPFMVLPLYAVLERLDPALLEAAADLGSPPWKAFLTVTLPLSLPGIAAGSLLVFIPSVGEFVIPELLGGPDTVMIGKVLWTEFFQNRDWPVAAALALVMLALLVGPIMLFQRLAERRGADGR